jgi:thymidylate synthase (FAD)
MPHVETLTPKKHAFNVKFGQLPLTHFKDYRKSIKVELLEPEPKDKMMKRIYQFVKATWSDTSEENANPTQEQMQEALSAMLSGKALQLGLETVNLTFKISGINRVDTHQIVRQRIGVTFSQQCTGDRDLRHNDVLVDECICSNNDLLDEFLKTTLRTKDSYSKMSDSLLVSIQTARTILPHNMETYILMNTNLATLLFFHQKRIDDGSQTWSINVIAQQMADEVCKAYPELVSVFEKNKTRFQFQRKASADRTNNFSTGLYVPKDDEFDYHLRDFLYQKKKEEMHFTGTPIQDKFYWGRTEVNEDVYSQIQEAYETNCRFAHDMGLSNEEIIEMNNKTNLKFANVQHEIHY